MDLIPHLHGVHDKVTTKCLVLAQSSTNPRLTLQGPAAISSPVFPEQEMWQNRTRGFPTNLLLSRCSPPTSKPFSVPLCLPPRPHVQPTSKPIGPDPTPVTTVSCLDYRNSLLTKSLRFHCGHLTSAEIPAQPKSPNSPPLCKNRFQSLQRPQGPASCGSCLLLHPAN